MFQPTYEIYFLKSRKKRVNKKNYSAPQTRTLLFSARMPPKNYYASAHINPVNYPFAGTLPSVPLYSRLYSGVSVLHIVKKRFGFEEGESLILFSTKNPFGIFMKNVLIVFFLLLTASCFTQETEGQYPPVNVPANYLSKINVVYTKAGEWEGKLDLYLPKDAKAPTPLLIDIHGGGWYHGVKESHYDFDVFFKQGWAVANVEYRLASQSRAPAAIEDVRCALIYLLRNAAQLNVNPEKVIVMGNSAGGHLAMMAGFLGSNRAFDKNCDGFEGIKVFAVIDKYGGADLRNPEKWATKSLKIWVKEKIINPGFLRSISPITYIDRNTPPVIIIHGNRDQLIDYSQSEALAKELSNNGVRHEFVTIEGGGHGQFSQKESDYINGRIIGFLEKLGVNR